MQLYQQVREFVGFHTGGIVSNISWAMQLNN